MEAFLEHYGCSSWKDFLLRILPLSFACIKKTNEAHVDYVLQKDDDYKRNLEFLTKLAIVDEETLIDYDFTSLRSNPIYQVNDTTFRVIYELFVFEMLHKGLYFRLSAINNSLSEKIDDFRGFYCGDFSENHLLYSVMDRMYGNRYKRFSGEEIRALGIQAEPDYYIRNGSKIFLFESKDVLIRADIKSSYDYEKLEKAFKEKFYFEEKGSGKIRKKAVLQLINNIKNVLEKAFSFDDDYKAKNVVIYPILITHSHQYDVLGLNNIINIWFKDELKKLQEEGGLDVSNVRPITLINIDDLIFHHDQFSNKKITLEGAIDSYIEYVTMDTNRRYRNEEHARMYSERSLVPFSTFFTNYVSEKSKIKAPELLVEKGFEVFKL